MAASPDCIKCGHGRGSHAVKLLRDGKCLRCLCPGYLPEAKSVKMRLTITEWVLLVLTLPLVAITCLFYGYVWLFTNAVEVGDYIYSLWARALRRRTKD